MARAGVPTCAESSAVVDSVGSAAQVELHADVTRPEAEPLVEAAGLGPLGVARQLSARTAAASGVVDDPADQLGADAFAPTPRVDADGLDLTDQPGAVHHPALPGDLCGGNDLAVDL